MEFFTTAILLLKAFLTAGGGILAVIGIVKFFSNMHDTNGPGIKSAVLWFLGGVGIILAAQILLPLITLDINGI